MLGKPQIKYDSFRFTDKMNESIQFAIEELLEQLLEEQCQDFEFSAYFRFIKKDGLRCKYQVSGFKI